MQQLEWMDLRWLQEEIIMNYLTSRLKKSSGKGCAGQGSCYL